jgi:enoyl-CoA hydratase/carnithine racemase
MESTVQDDGYLKIDVDRQVATIIMRSGARSARSAGWDLAEVFEALRRDNSVRVLILTGERDVFAIAPSGDAYRGGFAYDNGVNPGKAWYTFNGITRTIETMVGMEKPIIARVNGDAIGFGQSLVFSCDFIVAVEDAIIMDHHMGGSLTRTYSGQQRETGAVEFNAPPGDGGMALIPLYMTPCKAKEYLLLAKGYTAAELAAMNVINYAVPRDQLDAKVGEMTEALLKRNPYTVAWTKRVTNRMVMNHVNLTLDAGMAYEQAYFGQQKHTNGVNPTSFG